MKKKGINFIAKAVEVIEPAQNRLTLIDGTTLDYDYLVIATGPKLNFAVVPGSGPESGFTQSVCTIDHAEQSYRNFQALLENPGPVLVGAPKTGCMIWWEKLWCIRDPGVQFAWLIWGIREPLLWRFRSYRRAMLLGSKKGKWVHYSKLAFEKYFLRKMIKGYTEPVYEKCILRALGLKRLKS